MKKYICLRDDDTCFYTKKEELIDGYKEVWGKYPITIGIVPFSHGSQKKMTEFETEKDKYAALRNWEINASSEELTDYHKLHPVGENNELVNELKKQVMAGMVEIAQHGVSHRYNEYGPETTKSQVALSTIKAGKEYLSKLFDIEIKTFIPPSNTIDLSSAKYISKLGMTILSSGDIKYSCFVEKMVSKVKDPKFVKNHFNKLPSPIRKPSGITIMTSITYNNFNNLEDIFSKVVAHLDSYGFVSITTHYMLLSKDGWHGEHKDYQKNYLELIKIDGLNPGDKIS